MGIAVMHPLLRQAAPSLGAGYTASVSEIHHAPTVDAPSGTALKLGEVLAESRGQVFAEVFHYDPDGTGPAPTNSNIVFHASREGENPGEHAVLFTSGMESLELVHKVTNRLVFAEGALRAARWIVGQPPGLYTVADIVQR
jgi:4-hydroxy-tetrahydrodipicolinate reductase